MPIQLPSLDCLGRLLQIVRFDFEASSKQESKLKKDLFRYQISVDANTRSASPSFVRIKPPPPQSLRMVQKCVKGLASEIEAFTWHRRAYAVPCSADLLLHQPVQVAGTSAHVYSSAAGQIRVVFSSDDDVVLPKQVEIWQEQMECKPQGISNALIDFWANFWCRDSVSEERDIEQWPHFQNVLRGQVSPCEEVPINMSEVGAWVHAARHLPKNKATGVCGWRNSDLRLLPETALADLATILNSPNLQGFPAELMQARVAVLGKVPCPTLPSQSRPITIMSNLYRLWARVFCQQVIKVWSAKLPPCIRGCLKGRCAQDVSYWLQSVAETHILNDEPCSGLVLDLRKAFNLLPRAPIGVLMRVLGVPDQQINFWLTSLSKLHRLFHVQGHLGEKLHSTTGIPEGDPISVLGTVAFCWLYVSLLTPYVAPSAYVDNLAWVADMQESHGPALEQVLELTRSTKMQIDWGKTYYWATHAAQRKWWQKGSSLLLPPGVYVPVLHHVKELGSHLSFCKRKGLGHLVDTFDQAAERLHKLCHDPSPLDVKAHVVQSGVWPYAFFGALSVAPGRQRLHKLRSNAARAIVGRHHTLSPYAALYFMPNVTDPETYLMAHQACHLARTARLMPETARAVLKVASREGPPKTVHGPGSAIQLMFGRLGWVVKQDGNFKGPGHATFNVYTSSVQAIKKAIQQAWALEVQGSVQDRVGLSTFPIPSRTITQKLFQQFSAWEQTILSRHVTGAFLSNAEKSTWSRVVTSECSLCGALDTKHHRLFTCPALMDVRQDHLEIMDQVQQFFPWWTHMLAAHEPEDLPFLRLVCGSRTLPPTLPLPENSRKLYLFTDGSAHNSSNPEARLTYWSVVWCHGVRDMHDLDAWEQLSLPAKVSSYRVVAQGCTPKDQTVPRAELSAIVWAAQWCQQQPQVEAVIFTDSQFAIDQWSQCGQSGSLGNTTCPDLLGAVQITSQVQLRKVKAHNKEGLSSKADTFLKWTTLGNELADTAAKQARGAELPIVLQASDSIAESANFQFDHLLSFCKFLIDINVAEIELKQNLAEDELTMPEADNIKRLVWDYYYDWEEYEIWDGLHPNVPADAESRLSGQPAEQEYDKKLLEWLSGLCWPCRPQQDEQPKDVCFLELFVCFTMWSGLLPPFAISTHDGTEWVEHASSQGLQQTASSIMLVQAFVKRIRGLEQQLGRDLLIAAEKFGIGRLCPLGVPSRQRGLDARPQLDNLLQWVPQVLEGSRCFDDSTFLHAAILRRDND